MHGKLQLQNQKNKKCPKIIVERKKTALNMGKLSQKYRKLLMAKMRVRAKKTTMVRQDIKEKPKI